MKPRGLPTPFDFGLGTAGLGMAVMLATIVALHAAAPPSATPNLPRLEHVSELLAFSNESAKLGYGVRLRGTVLYTDPTRGLFLCDGSGVGRVSLFHTAAASLVGHLVQVTGRTIATELGPIIDEPTFLPIAPARFPHARPVQITELINGNVESQWVQVRGLVRHITTVDGVQTIAIADGGGELMAYVVRSRAPELQLAGAVVRARGLFHVARDANDTIVAVELLIPSFDQIQVEEPSPDDPSDLPITRISEIQKPVSESEVRRVRIRGTVLGQRLGETLVIRDESGQVLVETDQMIPVTIGEQVDVVGMPGTAGTALVLKAGYYRALSAEVERPAVTPVAASPQATPPNGPPLLTSVVQVRSLSFEEAKKRYPVRIRAVVTYYHEEGHELFVQDVTGGIFVSTGGRRLKLRSGEQVTVEGVSDPGDYAPIIRDVTITSEGPGSFPAPHPVMLADLVQGAFDSQWIEMHGVIRTLSKDGDRAVLEIVERSGRFKAKIPSFRNTDLPTELVGATVRMRGVCGGLFNQRRQLTGIQLFIPDRSHIQVIEMAPSDPFLVPEQTIASLTQFNSNFTLKKPVKVRGVVLHRQADRAVYLHDPTGSIYVETSEPVGVQPGDLIEVVANPVAGINGPVLHEAKIKKVGTDSCPPPVDVVARELLTGTRDSQLVRIEAVLLDQAIDGLDQVLGVQSGSYLFDAVLQLRSGDIPQIPTGSRLQLTGVCVVKWDEAKRPRSFVLLLRSPEDVQIVQRASWWTFQRIGIVLGIMSAAILASVGWGVALRRRVAEQTDQIRAQYERQTAFERQYRELVENAHDIIYTHDLDGNITSVNPAAERVTGYSRDEALRMNVAQIVEADQLALVRQLIEQKKDGQQVTTQELKVRRKNGESLILEVSSRPILQNGMIVGVQGIARDITERKRTEEALRQSEERFSKAFRATPVPIAISRLDTNQIVDVNESFVRLFGFDRNQLIGHTAASVDLWVDAEDRTRIIERLQRNESVRDAECRLRTRAGQILDTLVSVERIDLDGRPCALFITHDITERLRLEQQLRHAQKMEAIGQLAAGVAHDFNNIMTIIQCHTSLLLSTETRADVSENLHRILAAAERAAKLTRQLLAFSRKQVMRPRLLDLNQVVHGISSMLQSLIGESIELKCDQAPTLPAIYADASMLEQIIVNLAVNAKDAMPTGGVLTIRTSLADIAEPANRPSAEARSGTFVCLEVIDTGSGMDAKVSSKIFEPFFTTKPLGKGTGLGLSIVYGIVKQHQGWIEVESEIGRGTRFKLFFPRDSRPAEPPTSLGNHETSSKATGTILVVEDEKELRLLVGGVLRQSGYQVLEARSGAEALNVWREHRARIDLLLTDVLMPGGMSGFELADQLQRENPRLKIVFTSGYSVGTAASGTLREGTNFLPKPYSPAQLQRIIEANWSGQ